MLGPLHKKEEEDEEEKERGMESCETLAQRHRLFPPYGFCREPQLYKRVCPSVSLSVRWFVCPSVRGSIPTSFGGQK